MTKKSPQHLTKREYTALAKRLEKRHGPTKPWKDLPLAKKPSRASRLKAEARAEAPILKYINESSGLISLLYDLNALPEFAPLGSRRRQLMRSVAVGWIAHENWVSPKVVSGKPGRE